MSWVTGPRWWGHVADAAWIAGVVQDWPRGLRDRVGKVYRQLYSGDGRREANLWLLELSERVRALPVDAGASDQVIREQAEAKAAFCGRLINGRGDGLELARDQARGLGLQLPEDCEEEGEGARLACPLWWRRQLRQAQARGVESVAVWSGFVHRRSSAYASEAGLELWRQQQRRNASLLEILVGVRSDGQEISIADVAAVTVSNPAIRRAELMVRIAGFESVAKERGDVGLFLTLTTPSRFHAVLSKTGQRNPSYSGATPREAQQYLREVWARVRAAWARRQIDVYGIRVAEPHHDGTPHWHLLIWVAEGSVSELALVFRAYALQDSPGEKGAKSARCQVKRLDPQKGSAAGYVAKYIAKNLDGYGVKDNPESVEKVRAWASTWGLRQFQFLGGPPVTIWRELRREQPEGNGLLGQAGKLADSADWGGFVALLGGPTVSRKELPLRVFLRDQEGVNRYGEPKPDRVLGVVAQEGELAITRMHSWSVEIRRERSEPWSSVNNCTREAVAASEIFGLFSEARTGEVESRKRGSINDGGKGFLEAVMR